MIQAFRDLIGSFSNEWSDLVIVFCVMVLLLFTVQSFLVFLSSLYKR